MSEQSFTRTGNGADSATLESAVGGALPGQAVEITPYVHQVKVGKTTDWLAGEITAVQAAIEASPDGSTLQTNQAGIDSLSIIQRAIILALIDQLNVIRSKLPIPLGAITPAQALAAIRTKIGTL